MIAESGHTLPRKCSKTLAHKSRIIVPLIGLILLFPPSLPFLFNASSMAVGVIIVCLIAVLLRVLGAVSVTYSSKLANETTIAIFAVLIVSVHLFIASLIRPIESTRAIQSLGVLILFIGSAPLISRIVFSPRTDISIQSLCFIFVFIAMLSIVGLQPPTQNDGAKPTFPFTEPSFFAFTLVPLLVYQCVSSSWLKRLCWLLVFLGFGVFVKNLTVVTACGLVAIVSLPLRLAIPFVAVTALIATGIDTSYFEERLDISVDSGNISALVYAQGWQLLEESLKSSSGWGLGFQQLGFGYTNVPASYRLYYLLKRDSNLVDGGFLLSKMGSEFGIFGLIFVGIVTANAARCLFLLRSYAMGNRHFDAATVLALASNYSIVLEIYVRGANYFTGSVFLATMSAFFLFRVRTDLKLFKSPAGDG
jgi:hypothetical protein